MGHRTTAFLFLLALICGRATSQQRILPLGDSITESTAGFPSYRWYLWRSIDGADRCADFVGPNFGVAVGAPKYDDFDQDHAGFSGQRAVDIDLLMKTFPALVPVADIALIHLGSNDIILPLSATPPGTVNLPAAEIAMKSIIQRLRTLNPNIKIALAKIFPIPAAPTHVATWNTVHIPALAALSTPASPIVVVDQNSGFVFPTHYRDNVHPNDFGEKLIASNWFAALQASGWLLAAVPCVATLSPGCGNPSGTVAASTLAQTSVGPPSPPTTFTVKLAGMPASTTQAALIIGMSESAAGVLWGGCHIHPSMDLVMFATISGPGATASFSLSIPVGTPPGLNLYFQAATDGSAANDETTSNGIQVTVF